MRNVKEYTTKEGDVMDETDEMQRKDGREFDDVADSGKEME